MTMPAYVSLPDIPEEDWNAILLEAAREAVEERNRLVGELYDGWLVAPGIKRTARDWLFWFVSKFDEAYPEWQTDNGQAFQRWAEIQWLLDDTYFDRIKRGELLPPISRPWAALMADGYLFRKLQKDFRRWYKQGLKASGMEAD